MAVTKNEDGKQHSPDHPQQLTEYLHRRAAAAERSDSISVISPVRMDSDRVDLSTIKKRLQDGHRLVQCVSLLEDDEDQFLPRNILAGILTETTIQSLLRENDTMSRIKLGAIIGEEARIKLFAILILTRRTQYLERMTRPGLSDEILPLSKKLLTKILPSSKGDSKFLNRFMIHQSSVAVPAWDFTSHDMQEREYPLRFNMPFLDKERLSYGGQGTVWKVKIHPAHFTGARTGSSQNRWECFHKGPEFAVKQFAKKDEFNQELSALKCFYQSKTKHKHLIRVLAAYSQGNSYFLILPLAKGNLVEFWDQGDSLYNNPIWLLQQCRGLTDGLRRIHKCEAPGATTSSSRRRTFLRGRHGDIKPPNILWFVDESTGENRLVLSDFTLMRFHAQGSNTETLVHNVGRTKTYRAPELDAFPSTDSRISQEYDMWSLGCVFLEFISCHLVGYRATRGDEKYFEGDGGKGYETFSTTRIVEDFTYGRCFEDKFFIHKAGAKLAQIKVSVTNWFSYLRGLKHCSPALCDFLNLIQERMLVINPGKRWGAEEVLQRLEGILDQRVNPQDYYRSDRSSNTFHFSDLLRPWDKSSYDEQLLYRLNDQTEQFANSNLSSGVGLDISSLPDPMKHDIGLFDSVFVSPSSESPNGPSRSPTAKTMDTDHTISETSSIAHDHSSREASVDRARASSQDVPQQRRSLETTGRTPQVFQNTSNVGSIQVSTDFIQQDACRDASQDASQDAHFLCTPSKSHAPSSEATSIFTQDPRRSMSTRTGKSTLETDEFPVQVQSAGEKAVAGPETEAERAGAAGDSLQALDRGESGSEVEVAQRGSSPKHRLAIPKIWRSLEKRFKAVMKRGRQFLGRKA